MKILFTADIHIKLGQKNVPVDWAKNRFQLFLRELAEAQTKADLVILGGDIFDRVPTMEEVELYFELVASLFKPTIVISGNHEALKKDTTFLSYLKASTRRINNKVIILDEIATIEGIDFIPYNRLKRWSENPDAYDLSSNICVSHFRAEIPPHVKPEVDLDLFNKWKVVLAGDLHSYENCQRNILYPGSPYTTSFHRNLVDTGVILLDSETLEHSWIKLNLPQLIRKTVRVGDPMPATDYHHTIYQVEGDISELSSVVDNQLLDKKVLKRSVDTALILDSSMSIEQEISEFLTFILNLPEATVKEVINEFHNYSHTHS